MACADITFVRFDQQRLKLLSAAQMRRTEQAAIASGRVTGRSMMQTAGRGVVEALFRAEPHLAARGHRAVVLCGPGNNGGDGFVIARHLHSLGWRVEVFFTGDLDRLPADAAEYAAQWRETGQVTPLPDLTAAILANADVVFDALFGTGLVRPLSTGLLATLDMVAREARTIVAVDMPSGVSADTGRMLKPEPLDTTRQNAAAQQGRVWPQASHVVTFQRLKPGHVFFSEQAATGASSQQPIPVLAVVDLGIAEFEPPDRLSPASTSAVETIHAGGYPLRLGKPNLAHKYQHGHALILAGGSGHGGAGRLAARAALRVGAGAVTLGCPPDALVENAAQLNAIMLTPVADAAALQSLLTDGRKNALCLGPGLGVGMAVGQRTRSLVLAALASGQPLVLDADALISFADDRAALFARLHQRVVLTPHGGEFARLFPDIAEKLDATAPDQLGGAGLSKIDAAREAAARAGCCVLLKGSVTVIAAADGRVELSIALGQRQVPWLATAGAGDVLAGFITGLLARDFEPFEAAAAAAWLHVECAVAFGPGLIAEDLPDMLPRVLSRYQAELQSGDGCNER
uniref:NAD(P)H-hydrate dehydratase n=1 Tax=Pararhizobium sp. IMCC3301 TaxID=3067904 RepID=UPI0027410EB2|nr:NAD(P)H-hydrate dehydratase [Pararhizobium sp. IMCC3301]